MLILRYSVGDEEVVIVKGGAVGASEDMFTLYRRIPTYIYRSMNATKIQVENKINSVEREFNK